MVYLPEDFHFSLHIRLLVALLCHDLDGTRFFQLFFTTLVHHSKLTPVRLEYEREWRQRLYISVMSTLNYTPSIIHGPLGIAHVVAN